MTAHPLSRRLWLTLSATVSAALLGTVMAPAAFNRQTPPAKRAALWGAVQKVVFDEVPCINVGKFSSLSARSLALDACQPATWAFF